MRWATLAALLAVLGAFGTGTLWPDVAVAGLMAALAMYSGKQVVRQATVELASNTQADVFMHMGDQTPKHEHYPHRMRLTRSDFGHTSFTFVDAALAGSVSTPMKSKRIQFSMSLILAICIALMSALASAESYAFSHDHQGAAHTFAVQAHPDHPTINDHRHNNGDGEGDCGFGDCLSCHIFCHGSALLSHASTTSVSSVSSYTPIERDAQHPKGPPDRIERPNW